MRNAYIRNNVRQDKLTSDEVFLLVAMQEYRRFGDGDDEFPMTCSFTIEMIAEEFGVTTRRNVDSLVSAYISLVERGYITELRTNKTVSKSSYLSIRIVKADKDEYFNNVSLSLVKNIFTNDESVKEKKNMLHLLVLLVSYRGSNDYAYPTIEQLSDDSGLSEPTIHKAKDYLSDLGIIAYGNSGAKVNKSTGEIKNDNNKYTIADRSDYKEVLGKQIGVKKDNTQSNANRSDTMKMWNSIDRATKLATEGYGRDTDEIKREQDIYIPLVRSYMDRTKDFKGNKIKLRARMETLKHHLDIADNQR